MSIYLISYDLNKVKDYDKLILELKKHKCHRIQASLWLGDFSSTSTAQSLLTHFSNFVDNDDSLIISKVNKAAFARKRAFEGTQAWLDAHTG